MRFISNLACILAFAMGCTSAIANEPGSKARGKKPDTRPELVTMDQKVADSKTILIGEGVRIYFIDRQYREVPFIRAAGDGPMKNAILVVKVIKMLRPPLAEYPEKALIPIATNKDVYSARRSSYDEKVAQYVGKQGIYFGDFVVYNRFGDSASGYRPLEGPVTLFHTGSWTAKQGPTANPLPLKQLDEVVASIARVK